MANKQTNKILDDVISYLVYLFVGASLRNQYSRNVIDGCCIH